jgi:DNA-binding NarL/FixJ family response regulator
VDGAGSITGFFRKEPWMTEQIKVLIVEDHQATRDGLGVGLARETDIEVIGACGTSDEGLQLCQSLRPDVVLLDLHLPGSVGPKTMVKNFCSIPGQRIVVFSVERRMAFVKVVMGLGVAGYLLKSEKVSKVADTIRQVLNGKKNILSDELAADQTRITKSEEEVLRLIGRGLKYQDIADQRLTSPNTVRKQCEMLLLKLGLTTREELIAWAVNNGYASLED